MTTMSTKTTKKAKNRYVILIVLFLNQLSIGGSYAWSVFGKPLSDFHDWEYSEVTFSYSLLLLCLSFVGIIGGKFLDRFGPKVLLIVAGLMWGAGWFLTGCATSLWQVYLFFGLMCGVSGGLFYNPAVTTAVRWFPDKRGFASGMIVGAAGLSPLFLAPIANSLLMHFNVTFSFKALGIAFFVLAALTTWMISNPPDGWMTKKNEPEEESEATKSATTLSVKHDVTWKEMMKDKLFYLMWFAFLGGSISGIMIIGHASGIGQEVANMTASQGALMVGVMATANFFGRILMGALSDKIGRYATLILALIVNVADMVFLYKVDSFIGFVIALIILGICFGGVLAIFPTITSEAFGLTNMGLNYGIMFTAYGISAIIGPMTAAFFKDSTGSYAVAFLISAAFALISMFLVIAISKTLKKRKA